MSIFQASVEKKYLRTLDLDKVDQAWTRFTAHFHNPSIQDNIRAAKEEQYQGEFLIDLFVKVLGYTKNPQPEYNLTTELKNLKDSKKADGAIVLPSDTDQHKARAVIELKGTNTTDLGKVETQAFGYKNNQPGCTYVIISNFEKLRFYIDHSAKHIEWNLFTIDREQFDLFYMCLSADTLLLDLPLRIKSESLSQEEDITKKLYKDYSSFRNDIFNDIQKRNPDHDKLTLFKRTQKLLDRFLFIFFAEDRGLLPPNSIRQIINQWTTLRDELDAYVPLYNRFKKYFGYLNTGHKGKDYDIFAYNGGLFAPDELLDDLKIDDQLLYTHTQQLSNYDFESEVSVNILGHIFEHSLNDLEEIQAELAGETLDKSKTKRKKDGVFYTPRYITKYIVDNTVGKLCSEKRAALKIDEDEYYKGRKGRKKDTVKNLQSQLEDYREWLLQITICDPACGSGAFLNQAVERLMEEHAYIDELQRKLFGDAIPYSNIENTILENNIYGVDINRESVEIAKLSLWLHTAQKGRKLSSLNENIKCGNSLIDDPDVAGALAFRWEKEFPQVFRPKAKLAYHVVLTTHNSRTSARMLQYDVEKGDPVILTEREEYELTTIIGDVIQESNYHCTAYNICRDHVHMILVCTAEELSQQVQKIKSVSSRRFHLLDIPRGHDPLEHGGHLWSQKYYRADLDVWKLSSLSTTPGMHYADDHMSRATSYIHTNREKHNLPAIPKLQQAIENFLVTPEKAFEQEYEGGFDVVIGNPPYLRIQGLKDAYPEMTKYYDKIFVSSTGNYDIYALFMERSLPLINHSGLVSFILPHKWLIAEFGAGIRQFFAESKIVKSILHFEEHLVFEVTTYTCIITYGKKVQNHLRFKYLKPKLILAPFEWDKMSYKNLDSSNWNLMSEKKRSLFERLHSLPYTLKNKFAKIFQGIATSADDVYLIKGKRVNDHIVGYSKALDKDVRIESGITKPLLKGQDPQRYLEPKNEYFIIFPYEINEQQKARPLPIEAIKREYPLAYSYLLENQETLRARERRRFDNSDEWYLFSRQQGISEVEQVKIITPEIASGCQMILDEKYNYHNTKCYSFILKTPDIELYKYYLAILNSKVLWFFLSNTGYVLRGGYFTFKTKYLFPFPLPEEPEDKSFYIKAVDKIMRLTESQKMEILKFHRRLISSFTLDSLSKKLKSFYSLTFTQFLTELNKKKIKLSLTEQDEWEDYFNKYKSEILAIQADIDRTDREIDQVVYELYGLTEEEIRIVEESVA